MSVSVDAPPAVWPNYSELAKLVRMSTSGFGRFVRAWRGDAQVRKIGREQRVSPEVAVALLEARGLDEAVAEAEVRRLVARKRASMADVVNRLDADERLLEELRERYRSVIEQMQAPGYDQGLRKLFGSMDTERLRAAAGRGAGQHA